MPGSLPANASWRIVRGRRGGLEDAAGYGDADGDEDQAAWEGTQNLLCAYLAMAVFAGLAANTWWGAWRLDGVVAPGIALWAVIEARRAWAGQSCGYACQPGDHWLAPPRPADR